MDEALPVENDASDEAESESETILAPQPAWVGHLAAFLPVVICFLGTGRSPWIHGIAAAVIGLLALVFPPKGKVPVLLLALAGIVTALVLLPVIPLPWPHWPSWRTALVEDFQIALPSTWSPEPRVTLEGWIAMLISGLWFFWAAFRVWPMEQRTAAMRILAGGFVALALTAIACFVFKWKPPLWNVKVTEIGPYANRNHFSCLMAMTAMLCMGTAYELQRRKNRWWMAYALGVVPAFAVTLMNTSRGGLALFFVGIVLWFATSSMRSNAMQRMAIGGSVLLACTSAVVLFGQFILHRFESHGQGVAQTLANDGRLAVYAEAGPMVLNDPMTGMGLGMFATVFGMTHQLPNAYTRYRHPESDWLWFLLEGGWPATVALMIAMGLLISWMGPWISSNRKQGRRERRLRTAAGFAFLLSAGYGLVETPNHDLPHLLAVLLLGGMALRPHKAERARGVQITRLFQAGGILALAASVLWFATALGMATPFGLSVSEKAVALAKKQFENGENVHAWQSINTAVTATPANWECYFLRAEIGLKLGHPDSEAMTDFGRARYLEPHVAHICMAEADYWLNYVPANAVPAWREAMRRQPSEEGWRYRNIVAALAAYPELRPAVRDLATTPSLFVLYLSLAPPAEFAENLQLLLTRFPGLEALDSRERLTLATTWRNQGDRKQLEAFLTAHPLLEKDTWPVKAQNLADSGHMEEAFRLLQRYVHPTWNVTADETLSIQQLARDFEIYPSDAKRGFALYAAQRDRGLWNDALATLTRIASLPSPPRNVYFEIANLHAQKGDFAKAWQYAQQYLSTAG